MAELAPVALGDGLTIYVETTESAVPPGQSRIAAAGAEDAAARAIETGAKLTESVAGLCRRVVDGLKNLPAEGRPRSAELEFGLSISLEGNVYVVKGSGEGTIAIRAQWEFGDEQPE